MLLYLGKDISFGAMMLRYNLSPVTFAGPSVMVGQFNIMCCVIEVVRLGDQILRRFIHGVRGVGA